jgi:hypothetical protein
MKGIYTLRWRSKGLVAWTEIPVVIPVEDFVEVIDDLCRGGR